MVAMSYQEKTLITLQVLRSICRGNIVLSVLQVYTVGQLLAVASPFNSHAGYLVAVQGKVQSNSPYCRILVILKHVAVLELLGITPSKLGS